MKKEFKGTKGKWCTSPHDPTVVIADIESSAVLAEFLDDRSWLSDSTKEEAIANAQLTAAAPEMLKVLQKLVHLQEYKMENGKWEGYIEERMAIYDDVKKVINKALEL